MHQRPILLLTSLAGLLAVTSAQGTPRLQRLREQLLERSRDRERAGALAEILAAPSGKSLQDLEHPPAPPPDLDEAERAGLAAMLRAAPPPKAVEPVAKRSPAKPPAPSASYRPEYLEMLRLLNEARAQPRTCGDKAMAAAPPLALDPHLVRAAEGHSRDMATKGYFSHQSQDGRSPWVRIREAGFSGFGSGENIYSGPSTHGPVASAGDAMRSWLKSPGHCRNLMSPGAKLVGVGAAKGPKSYSQFKWTQVFGVPPG